METKTFSKTVHVPMARGHVSVPARQQNSTVNNIALDSVSVKPTIETPAKVERVTLDMMPNKQVPQQIIPVEQIVPTQTTPLQTAPLQTAVQVAAKQPTADVVVPMNLSANNNVAAVPMVQVAPMQEVAIGSQRKEKSKKFDAKKFNIKKIDAKKIKDAGANMLNKVKTSTNPTNFRVGDVLRYGIVAVILVIMGYLAYDTWTTNQRAKDIFSQSAVAVSSNTGESEGSASSEPVYAVSPEMPKFLSIPKIGINNVKIEQVGLLGNNKIDTPKDINNVAWYDGSVRPGEKGALFINGHINDVGSGGIFDQLKTVAVGDKIVVERGDGTKFNYEVVETETLPTSSINMNKSLAVHGNNDQGVNLMTCAGTYNFATMSYSHRVLVYGVRV